MTLKKPIVLNKDAHSELALNDKIDASVINIASRTDNIIKVYDSGLHATNPTPEQIGALPIKGGNVDSLTVGNKNVIVDGTAGLNSTTLPLLKDFNSFDNKTGFYYAYGAGTTNPTPNCPPLSKNNRLTVTVRNIGNVVHYEVIENTSREAIKWIGEYYGNDGAANTVWIKVFTKHDTLTASNLQESNPADTYYVKLATFTNSTVNNCNLQLLVSGLGDYGNAYFGTEIVDISSRGSSVLYIRVTKLTESNTASASTYGYVKNSDGSYDVYIKGPAYGNSTKVTILNKYYTNNLKLVENRVAITTKPTGFVENTNINTVITTDNIDMYGSSSGNLIGFKSFTSSGTYTPNPKAKKLRVCLMGTGTAGFYSRVAPQSSGYGVSGDMLYCVIDNPNTNVTVSISAPSSYTNNISNVLSIGSTKFGSLLATNTISAGDWNRDYGKDGNYTNLKPSKQSITIPAIISGDVIYHSNSPMGNSSVPSAFPPVYTSSYGGGGNGSFDARSGIVLIWEYA